MVLPRRYVVVSQEKLAKASREVAMGREMVAIMVSSGGGAVHVLILLGLERGKTLVVGGMHALFCNAWSTAHLMLRINLPARDSRAPMPGEDRRCHTAVLWLG
jgi:hypothetical protein